MNAVSLALKADVAAVDTGCAVPQTVGVSSQAPAFDADFFREVYDSAPLGIARVSLDGRFIDVNPAFCKLLQETRESTLGLSFFDITHPGDVAESRERLRQMTAGEINRVSLEKRYLRPSGTSFWVHVNAANVLGADGKPCYCIAIFSDITDRKDAEAALKAREEQYRTVIATTADGFWVVDAAGQIVEVNDAYVRLSGYSREELIGRHVSELDAYYGRDAAARHLASRMNDGDRSYTTYHRRRDGSLFPVRINVGYTSPLASRVYAFIHDLSDRHKISEELERLQRSQAQSKRAAEQARQMLVRVSEELLRHFGQELHDDIGQILTGAALMAGTVSASLAKQGIAEARTASQLTDLLNELIEKVRSISRGLYPVGLETHGLQTMLQLLVDYVGGNTEVAVELDVGGLPATLLPSCALQVYRIVQEAVSNALRHSRASRIAIQGGMKGAALSVRIVDDGVGMGRAQRGPHGPGIGVATMRARASRVGGRLRITSPRAGGTCVELTVPLNRACQQAKKNEESGSDA